MTARKQPASEKGPMGLGIFEGQAIGETGAETQSVNKAINDAMKADAHVWHHGDRVMLLLGFDVIDVRHPSIAGAEDMLRRVHKLKGVDAAVMDTKDAAELLAESRDKITRLLEEQSGVQRLGEPLDGEPEA